MKFRNTNNNRRGLSEQSRSRRNAKARLRQVRYTLLKLMNSGELSQEIIATYQRHGWNLKRVLLRPATRAELKQQSNSIFGDAPLIDSEVDALWFARPSHAGREAWELRLLAEQSYALFEAFEADETEEDREDARREMENRMRECATSV
jgi:hypothetical protein